MNIIELIEKKRDKKALTKAEIEYIIEEYTNNQIPDYQMSSLLMAIYLNSMNQEEIANLTEAMINSGDVMDLSMISENVVDKHSTGGVGDKTTLVLGPILAALNIPVAKMSGRGLGQTGGTIDKLESIDGFHVEISEEQFIKQVKDIKIAIVGQTKDLVPADKKIYALRDTTGTVSSPPLIASSIMSKKIASGAKTIILDVKCGSGAFMKNLDEAEHLAKLMIGIGQSLNRNICIYITNMEEPLGNTIGNSIEVIEAIETLKGNGPEDLNDLVIHLAAQLLKMTNTEVDFTKAQEMVKNVINNGEAYRKFIQYIQAQGGSELAIENLKIANKTKTIIAKEDGWVFKIDALDIGNAALLLGAGRLKKDDQIDHEVGIRLMKKIGDFVKKGETILEIYYHDETKAELALAKCHEAIKINKEICAKPELILKVIT